MSDIPALKFEKSTNFLNDQLNIQLNNKKLVIDIISNINLILKSTNKKELQYFSSIQKSANEFLQNISKNITIIEELNREIKHITSDLIEVIEEINKKEKSTEYYIAAISTVKENIEKYTSNFQAFEKKINQDNTDFNEFISNNNFKYNFISNSDNDSYEFSDFSIDDTVLEKNVNEVSSNGKDKKINASTNEFKSILSDLSEDAISSLDLISTLKKEFPSDSNSLEKTFKTNKDYNSKVVSNDVIPNEELEEENSNIVIDYSSIYKNYYNNKLSSVEENISSEYSNFYSSSKTSDSKKHEPLFLLSDLDDDIENIEEAEAVEQIKEIETVELVEKNALIEPTKVEENIESIKPVEEIKQAEEKEKTASSKEANLLNENDILQLTDDDILAEILEEEIAKDTAKVDINDIIFNDLDLSNELLAESLLEKEISISDTISDDDILSELLASDEFTANLIAENTNLIENDSTIKDDVLPVNYTDLSDYCNIDKKIQDIKNAKAPNNTLIISEKENKVFLPYTKDEVEYLLKHYPQAYHSIEEVIQQEYILPFDVMQKHPAQSRFLETYHLMKNRENKSAISAILYSLKFLYKYDLSPAVIAACKSKKELDAYLSCLKLNTLNKFTYFKTVYQVNPL